MYLWHLEPGERRAPPEGLGEDLALHLRYASISTILVQVGDRQQAYLRGTGCPGCGGRRCAAWCRAALLRRALGAHGVARQLRLVAGGLAARPYARVALAAPGRGALPLDGGLLQPWHEARLWVTWRHIGGRRWAGVALAVGAGPDPAAALRAVGWLAVCLPAPRALCAAPRPAMLPYGLPWRGHPFLLTPCRPLADEEPAPHARPGATEGDLAQRPSGAVGDLALADEALLARASSALDQLGADDRADESPGAGWPAGPEGLSPEDVAALAALIIAAPELREGRPGQAGLGLERVRRLTGRPRAQVAALLCWLDMAGALAAPRDPSAPWRDARPLATDDIGALAARLRDTPHPGGGDLAAAFPGRGGAR